MLQSMGLQSVGQDLGTEQRQHLPSYLVPYHTLISVRFNACPPHIFVYAACSSSFFFYHGKHSSLNCSVDQSCPTLVNPMDCSTPGFPVFHHLPKFSQVHVHSISDAIQPSPLFCLQSFQQQGLFQLVSYSHQMTEILELQHQSFQHVFKVYFPED